MLRAFLYELGHVVPQGINNVPRIAAIVTETNSDLPEIARIECRDLLEQIEAMTLRMATSVTPLTVAMILDGYSGEWFAEVWPASGSGAKTRQDATGHPA